MDLKGFLIGGVKIFVFNFIDSYKVSRDRVLLARDSRLFEGDDYYEGMVLDWARRRHDLFCNRLDWFGCFGQVTGYFAGNYTTFCPTQNRLNLFDRRARSFFGKVEREANECEFI